MLGNYLGEAFLKGVIGELNQTQVSQAYLVLLTGEPVVTVNSSNVVTGIDYSTYEPTIGTNNYAREQIGSTSSGFTDVFDVSIKYNTANKYYYTSNVRQIKFNKASGTWTANSSSSITHFAISNAPTGGQILAWGELTTPITVQANMSANVEVGQAVLRLYGEVTA